MDGSEEVWRLENDWLIVIADGAGTDECGFVAGGTDACDWMLL